MHVGNAPQKLLQKMLEKKGKKGERRGKKGEMEGEIKEKM
jgi:hypothetical protein